MEGDAWGLLSDAHEELKQAQIIAARYRTDATRYRAIRYGVLNNVEPDYTGPDVPESTLEEQMEDFDKVADSMVEKVAGLGVVV